MAFCCTHFAKNAAPALLRGFGPARRTSCSRAVGAVHAGTCSSLSQPTQSRPQRSVAVRAASAPESVTEVEGVDERLPVTIITGFLGSGKTTLLNHILSQKHGKRIAIIENEFGEVGIDNDLIVAREDVDGASLTILENGCLCCVVLDDLSVALKRLHERREQFDHIVIETTGLANPAPVISTLFMDESLPKMVRLDGVCTVVDAKHVSRHLDAAEREDGRSNEAIEQLAYADRIVINKRDLVSKDELDELTDRIRSMNAMASMRTALKADVPVDYVLGIGGFALEEVATQMEKDLAQELEEGHSHEHDHEHCHDPACSDPSHNHSHDHDHGHDHGHGHSHEGHSHSHEEGGEHKHTHKHAHHKNVHDDNVKSASFVIEGDMDLEKVNYWLGALVNMRGDDIYRMKGILAIKDYPERFVFQGVHNLFEGGPDRLWKEGEARQSKMVFIGKELDMDLLKEGFEDCKA